MKQKRRSGGRSRRRSSQLGKLEIVADEQTLTPFGGTAVLGELVRRLELIPALDRAIEGAPKIGGLAPIKARDRGASPGELLLCLADSILCGADALSDLERLRADEATRVPAGSRRRRSPPERPRPSSRALLRSPDPESGTREASLGRRRRVRPINWTREARGAPSLPVPSP